MEIKVRDLGEIESKSTQEIEKQLLEKHEAQQASMDNPKPQDEVQRVNLQENPKETPKETPKEEKGVEAK